MDLLQYVHALLNWGAQKWTQAYRCVSAVLSREERPPPCPSGDAPPNAAQEDVGFIC